MVDDRGSLRDVGPPPGGVGGTLVRIGAASLAVVSTPIAVIAIIDPTNVGLSRPVTIGFSLVVVGLHLTVALLPWHRLWGTARGTWLLFAYVGSAFAISVSATALADPPSGAMPWLLVLVVSVSGVTLPRPHHTVLSGAALIAMLATLAAAGWPSDPVELGTFTMIYLFLAVFTSLAAELNRRTVWWTARAQERSDRLAQIVGTVADAGADLTTVDVDAIFDTLVRTAAELGADMVGLYVTTDAGLLAYSATHGIPEDIRDSTFTPAEGLVGRVLEKRGTVVVPDYAGYEHALPEYVELGLRTAFGTPIMTTDGLAGILILGHLVDHEYDAVETRSLELLAAHAGRALEIAHAYDEQEVSLERLRELDRLKQDFVATVSHELRTPLTIIGGLSETLDSRWGALTDDERHRLLRRVRANASSLDAIIVKLLDFVRLERGELSTRLEPFEATGLVQMTAQRLEPLVRPERQLAVRVEDDVAVRGDERLIERVLENLIVNATRHTPPGSSIIVSLATQGATARFTVRDDGHGIADEDLARLGEQFYRGGDPNERRTGGLGLGLALSNEILRRHGSALHVSSSPGEGAEFRFDLPTVRVAPEGPATELGRG